jgi:hypothetical protein
VRNAIGAEDFVVINCHGVGYKLWEGTDVDFNAEAAQRRADEAPPTGSPR